MDSVQENKTEISFMNAINLPDERMGNRVIPELLCRKNLQLRRSEYS